MASSGPRLQLFHRISDPAAAASCAKARRYVVDAEMTGHVRFRNLDEPGVAEDFSAFGGTDVPALWTGERLVVGAEAVIARLASERDVGRDD